MNELFPAAAVASKSPRLLWLEKHNIKTRHLTAVDPKNVPSWCAYIGDFNQCYRKAFDGYEEPTSNRWIGFGYSEDEAITTLAKNRGIRLWMEEALTKGEHT